MLPDEIKVKRSVINELRSLLKRMDSEAVDSELNPPAPAESVELIVPEAEQADPKAMPDPTNLDPAALEALEKKEEVE